MINELNIHIFDYIFSINEDIRIGIKEEDNCYRKELDNKILLLCKLEDFWDEYITCFNTNCILIDKTIIGTIITYNNFPRMNVNTKKEYLDFKLNEIKTSINDNGEFITSEIEKILKGIENNGRKTILDYCEQNGIIEYNGKVFLNADNYPAYSIIYDNIKAVIYNESENLYGQNIIQNVFNGINYGTLNQTNNIENVDEKIFDIVMEKIDALKIESNLKEEQIQELKECCNRKDKNKLVQLLKEIVIGTGTNLIATGILAMFGLM